jgi:hypothetical protein
MRDIEHQFAGDRACGHDLGKQTLPDPTLRLSVAAVVDRRMESVRGGRVLPTAPDLQHMQNTADDPPVVDPRFARLPVRKVWLDPRPGFI